MEWREWHTNTWETEEQFRKHQGVTGEMKDARVRLQRPWCLHERLRCGSNKGTGVNREACRRAVMACLKAALAADELRDAQESAGQTQARLERARTRQREAEEACRREVDRNATPRNVDVPADHCGSAAGPRRNKRYSRKRGSSFRPSQSHVKTTTSDLRSRQSTAR